MTILERHYDQLGINFRAVWDFYIKFYTVFITVNFASLGLVVQYVPLEQRQPIAWSFILQNVISATTAVGIALYSRHVTRHQSDIIELLREREKLPHAETASALTPAIPEKLATWAGFANMIAHVLFIGCWISTFYIQLPDKK